MLAIKRAASQRGFSLLEQAMALPVLLLIIGAAIDINTLLQSYSALREAVNASLRCVYTTDGKCVSAAPDLRPRLYNYFLLSRNPEYLVDTFDFSGTASWINRPIYQFSSFQAEVLSSVEYEAQSANVSIARRYFPAHRSGEYTLRMASMPYITGSGRNPVSHYRGARSTFPEAHAGSYPDNSLALNSIDLQTNSQDIVSTFEFKAPDLQPNVFESLELERPPSAQHSVGNFQFSAPQPFINVALHITGNKAGTAIGALGGIQIDLQHFVEADGRWQAEAALGAQQLGRAAGQSTQANFVIRGLLPEFIDQSVPEYQELHDYSPVRLHYGDRYRVRFTLHSDSGTVGWQGGQLRIYYPVQESRRDDFECQGGLPPCSSADACQTRAPSSIFQAAPVVQQELAVLRYDAPTQLESCSTGVTSLQESLTAHGIFECAENFEVREEQGACPVQTASRACPSIGTTGSGAPNVGVPQVPATDGLIRNSSEAALICPPPSMGTIGPAQNPRWRVRAVAVPSNFVQSGGGDSFVLTKENCTAALEWPRDSRLGEFPHLSYTRTNGGFDPYYSDSVDPTLLKADPSSPFACSEFPLASSVVDVPLGEASPEQRSSLFYGPHSKPDCEWSAALRQDAVHFSLMPPQAFFTPDTLSLSTEKERSMRQPLACVDPNPEFTWSEPTERTLVPGGPFGEATLPPACTEIGNSCAAEFAGFGTGVQGSTTYNFDYAAQHFGFNELQAHYPRARWNCAEKDCATIQVLRDGAFMAAQGSIRVPLYVLGRRTIELRFSNRERREAEFSH